MTHRIAIGGFLHESHSFAPRPTTYADFVNPAGFPPYRTATACSTRCAPRPCRRPARIAVAEAAGATLVPLAWGFANPAGPVQDEAFERIAALICARLSEALDAAPLDGVYLDLHGAAVVESFPDAEGELLRRVRAIVGDLPLTISLDPHCNLTAQMVRLADASVPFRTYPHVDMKAAGAQAMRLLLQRIERGAPWARAFRQLEFWIPLGSQCTLMPPMQEVMQERASLAERMGVVGTGVLLRLSVLGLSPIAAPALAAFADTQAKADAAADAFAAHVAARESEFRAGHVAGGRGGGRGDAHRARRVAAGGAGGYAGQSRRWRAWRHDRTAGGTGPPAREGRVVLPDQRCRERRRVPRRRRGRAACHCRWAASRTACRSPARRGC